MNTISRLYPLYAILFCRISGSKDDFYFTYTGADRYARLLQLKHLVNHHNANSDDWIGLGWYVDENVSYKLVAFIYSNIIPF